MSLTIAEQREQAKRWDKLREASRGKSPAECRELLDQAFEFNEPAVEWHFDYGNVPSIEEVGIGDTIWPNLGRVGEWPCRVLNRDVARNQLLVEATFDCPAEHVFISPLFVVLDMEDGCVLDSSQNVKFATAFYRQLHSIR
jgi:hypothetical protein